MNIQSGSELVKTRKSIIFEFRNSHENILESKFRNKGIKNSQNLETETCKCDAKKKNPFDQVMTYSIYDLQFCFILN